MSEMCKTRHRVHCLEGVCWRYHEKTDDGQTVDVRTTKEKFEWTPQNLRVLKNPHFSRIAQLHINK